MTHPPPPLPDLREAAQSAHIALTCISTHPTLDMSDYLRGRVDAAAAGLEAALADDAGLRAAVRLVCEATPGQLPMALDALRDHAAIAAAQPSAEPDHFPDAGEMVGPATGAWQPIETAPKDGTSFLGWVAAVRWSSIDGGGLGLSHDESTVDFCWYLPERPDETGGYFTNAAGQIGDAQDITHWMPLPSAPKEIK